MRTQVDVQGMPAWANQGERLGMARFGKIFPGQPDAAREFLGRHAGRDTGDQARATELRRDPDHAFERAGRGSDKQLDVFALLFRLADDAGKKVPLMLLGSTWKR